MARVFPPTAKRRLKIFSWAWHGTRAQIFATTFCSMRPAARSCSAATPPDQQSAASGGHMSLIRRSFAVTALCVVALSAATQGAVDAPENLMPKVLAGVSLGMTETDFRKVRPAAESFVIFNEPEVRETIQTPGTPRRSRATPSSTWRPSRSSDIGCAWSLSRRWVKVKSSD